VQERRTISVTVPPGVDSEHQLQMRGQGGEGSRGGPPGDLFIFLRVAPHELFTREGDDLIVRASIDIAQAVLGDEIEVPCLEGTTRVKISAGTQDGLVIRLRDRGVQHVRGHGRGSLHVAVHVEIPRTLTDKQRDLFRQLSQTFRPEEASEAHQRSTKGLFDRVKDVLAGE
jgi:molecular chaperone DnaJ